MPVSDGAIFWTIDKGHVSEDGAFPQLMLKMKYTKKIKVPQNFSKIIT